MSVKKNNDDNVLTIFRSKQVITLNELAELSKCSIKTIQRRLKKGKTYRSYNQNGRYYVLADVPAFNQDGIWQFKDIFFSKHGNLRETLVHLVEQSEAGCSVSEMSSILGMPVHKFLCEHFKNAPALERNKHQGSYIYFSKHSKRYAQQKDQREKLVGSQARQNSPSNAEAVIILVELIKHLNDTVEQLTRRVRRRGLRVSIEAVHHLLLYHDLLKKLWIFNDPSAQRSH